MYDMEEISRQISQEWENSINPPPKEGSSIEKFVIGGILLFPVLCIIVGFILYAGALSDSSGVSINGSLPSGWSEYRIEDFDKYVSSYTNFSSSDEVDYLYFDNGDGYTDSSVLICFSDTIPERLLGNTQDEKLLKEVIQDWATFHSTECGTMEVAGCMAGYCEEQNDTSGDLLEAVNAGLYGLEMCFVKGDKFFFVQASIYRNIFLDDRNHVLSIVNKIKYSGEEVKKKESASPQEKSLKDMVIDFIGEYNLGSLADLEKYVLMEEGRFPDSIIDEYEDFHRGDWEDISRELSNITVEELWQNESEAAVRADFDIETEINGRTVSLPDSILLRLQKKEAVWLVADIGDGVPLSEPADATTDPVPAKTGTPVTTTDPTQAPISKGQVLFSDSFTVKSELWPIYSDSHGIAYYYDGSFRVKHRAIYSKPEICVLHRSFENFILEIDTSLIEPGKDSWVIIACRTDYWGNGYQFMISPDGNYAIVVQYNTKSQEFLRDPSFSEHLKTGKRAINRIRIECIGSDISLYANENLLAEFEDDTYTSGALGLGLLTASGTNTAEAMFDNLIITAPLNE